MLEEDINQEFRLKKIDEIRNCFIEEINQNELISNKHKKVFRVLNYINYLLIVIYAITGCIFISAFSIGITSSAIGLRICAITAGIKKYKSITKKEEEEA